MSKPRNLAILLFDDAEVLDFCGPIEVFSVANNRFDSPAFNVFIVTEKLGPVKARDGLSVNPDYEIVCWCANVRRMASRTVSSRRPTSSARKRNTRYPCSCNNMSLRRSRR